MKFFDITLNPVTDGILVGDDTDVMEHAFIFGTNGEKRFADIEEVKRIIEELEPNVGSFLLGGAMYMVIFNMDKTFKVQNGRCLVGSVLVMAYEGDRLGSIPDEDIDVVMDLLESRRVTVVDGSQKFSAFEIL